jgi:hypothetical protein
MRALKTFLALLLCLAIPLQGFARMLESGAPCRMEHGMAMPAADTDGAMDCCDTAAPAGKACKHCQAGAHCPCAGVLFQASMPGVFPPITGQSPRLARSILFPTSFVPAGLWRPPARFWLPE